MLSARDIVDILLEGDDGDLSSFVKGAGVLGPGAALAQVFAERKAEALAQLQQGAPQISAKGWFYTPAVKFGDGRYEVHANALTQKAFVGVYATIPKHIQNAFNIYSGMDTLEIRKRMTTDLEPENISVTADKLYAWVTRQMQKWKDLAYLRNISKKVSPAVIAEFRRAFPKLRGMAGWEANGYAKSDVTNNEAAKMAAWMRARVAQLGIAESSDIEDFVRSSRVAITPQDFRFRRTRDDDVQEYEVYVRDFRDATSDNRERSIGEVNRWKADAGLEKPWKVVGGAEMPHGYPLYPMDFDTPDWNLNFKTKEDAAYYLWSLRKRPVSESTSEEDMDTFLRDAGVTVTPDDFLIDSRSQRTMGYSNGNTEYYVSYKRLLYKGKPVYLGRVVGYHDYNRTGHSGHVGFYVDVPTTTKAHYPINKRTGERYKRAHYRTYQGYGAVRFGQKEPGTEIKSLFDACKYLLSLLKVQHPLKHASEIGS